MIFDFKIINNNSKWLKKYKTIKLNRDEMNFLTDALSYIRFPSSSLKFYVKETLSPSFCPKTLVFQS